jgi:transcriptional regulator with GAF, ATPase, and Fis domain
MFTLAHAAGSIAAPPAIRVRDIQTLDVLPPATDGAPAAPADSTAPPWEARIPVGANGEQVGLIALGPKESGARIDDADLTLLNMVAAQLAIAMQNAEYVKQIETQKAEIEQLRRRVEAENVALRAEVRSVSQFKEIIGASAALQRVLALVEKVAPTIAPIMIIGETGTGKELIARAIHDLSPRRNGPLISINCPAIPAGLAESELFGHERGAFTDAVEARPGKFELADGGTIFLDEVADLTPNIQVKLLRVLQEHETQRLGSSKVRKLDLRVVAATNRNLQEEMHAGRFREDLYYRLAAVVVSVPPLRERTGDIPMLASYFLDRAATMYQKPVTGFSLEALDSFGRYNWPGNIRELQHIVDRAVLLCASDVVTPEHLGDLAATQRAPRSLGTAIREEKLRRVKRAVAQTGGNQAAAARLLGMSPNNLARLMKNLGLK